MIETASLQSELEIDRPRYMSASFRLPLFLNRHFKRDNPQASGVLKLVQTSCMISVISVINRGSVLAYLSKSGGRSLEALPFLNFRKMFEISGFVGMSVLILWRREISRSDSRNSGGLSYSDSGAGFVVSQVKWFLNFFLSFSVSHALLLRSLNCPVLARRNARSIFRASA